MTLLRGSLVLACSLSFVNEFKQFVFFYYNKYSILFYSKSYVGCSGDSKSRPPTTTHLTNR